MKKITAALLGAGNRGMHAYAEYALKRPDEIQFTAVAEPDDEKREIFARQHNLHESMCFKDWKDFFESDVKVDAVIIATMDRMHFEPVKKSIEKGYHILLEKPMSPDPKESWQISEMARKYDRVFSVCHVMRYTAFSANIRRLIDEGRIGELMNIEQTESVGFFHYAHSFVRGNWRDSNKTSPMILQKSCHDMDMFLYFIDADCSRVSSFGSLTHFREENAPDGAPNKCIEGCPAEESCPYYAPSIYLDSLKTEHRFLVDAMTNDRTEQAVLKALKEGPYGRCVYRCDNNVVDHQVVNLEFSNKVTVSFTMSGFTDRITRTVKLMGTKGEIYGDVEKNELVLYDFKSGKSTKIELLDSSDGHGGGDRGIMNSFVQLINEGSNENNITWAGNSAQSHLMAHAAEESRLTNKVVEMDSFTERFKKSLNRGRY